jgi:23S rRNA (cytosine1962-C5)-methyltransferase
MSKSDYELLDFGQGRKLERFGACVIDRPCPAADGAQRERPAAWAQAAARYEKTAGNAGRWLPSAGLPPWTVRFGPLSLELKLGESGQVGVFAEQADNWRWIAEQVRAAGAARVLNLFAYTGASTLAAAAAGAEVVHVDASSTAVAAARRNAQLSGLDRAVVRWIIDDVRQFVRRQLRRGDGYDAVILDPPAYGHGPRGQRWQLEEHLAELLAACWELASGRGRFLLVSCHSGRLGQPGELADYVRSCVKALDRLGTISACEMSVVSAAGRKLHSGAAVRWSRKTA